MVLFDFLEVTFEINILVKFLLTEKDGKQVLAIEFSCVWSAIFFVIQLILSFFP